MPVQRSDDAGQSGGRAPPAMSEEDAPSVDAVAPVAALLRSDDDSQRAEGAAQLRALAFDPRCDAR